MSDKKKTRRRKDEYTGPDEQEVVKPSKDEYNVAKWLRRNVKTKKTKFLSHNVEYFTANKALDALLKSKFSEGDSALFPSREHAIEFLDIMLEHKFFHRAKKVPVFPEELKSNKKKASETTSSTSIKASTEKKEEKIEKTTDVDSQIEGGNGGAGRSGNDDNATSSTQNKEKRKRKIKLEMHPEQLFVDGSEAYVWIYDPIPLHYWIFGFILVLGAIVVCLFPLWPPILRKGVYYLSIAAAGFLVFILVLTILRLIVFVIIWVLSGGKLNFWIFPNLTEDVGFFASFWPLYESKYYNADDKGKKKLSKKKKKDKDSDAEDNDDNLPPIEAEKIENVKEHDAEIPPMKSQQQQQSIHKETDEVDDDDEECGEENIINQTVRNRKANSATVKGSRSGSESESGSRSSTGKDFEMVDSNDVDTT